VSARQGCGQAPVRGRGSWRSLLVLAFSSSSFNKRKISLDPTLGRVGCHFFFFIFRSSRGRARCTLHINRRKTDTQRNLLAEQGPLPRIACRTRSWTLCHAAATVVAQLSHWMERKSGEACGSLRLRAVPAAVPALALRQGRGRRGIAAAVHVAAGE
jgi:hypothetical protein